MSLPGWSFRASKLLGTKSEEVAVQGSSGSSTMPPDTDLSDPLLTQPVPPLSHNEAVPPLRHLHSPGGRKG